MTFAEVLPTLLKGKKFRRPIFATGAYLIPVQSSSDPIFIQYAKGGDKHPPSASDLLASDWELVEEPAKTHVCSCNEVLLADIGVLKRDLSGRDTLNEILKRELAEAKLGGAFKDLCDKVVIRNGRLAADVDRLTSELEEERKLHAVSRMEQARLRGWVK